MLNSTSRCSHDVQVKGMCAVCGEDLISSTDLNADQRTTIELVHGSTASMSISISLNEAQRLERATAARLINTRKLSLVVDLDQTLVHATTSSAVNNWYTEELPHSEAHFREWDIHKVILDDDESKAPHYIKLRNGVRTFLERISKKFELHIYTMGSASYGSIVARLLDPVGDLFFDRIVTRDHTNDWTKKELSRIFPCEDAMVLILDDRSDVWTHSPNLIQVRPCKPFKFYLDFFFMGIGDINWQHESNSSIHQDLNELKSMERKQNLWVPIQFQMADEALLIRLESILNDLHFQFFKNYDRLVRQTIEEGGESAANILHSPSALFASPAKASTCRVDMKVLLSSLKFQILSGVYIAFTGVIPMHSDPIRSEIWRRASEFGAVCFILSNIPTEEDDDSIFSITHLIAANPETDRAKYVRERRGPSVAILRPQWLWDSIWSFQRQPESPYLWNEYFFDDLQLNSATIIPLEAEDEDFLAELEDEGSVDFETAIELSPSRKRLSSNVFEEENNNHVNNRASSSSDSDLDDLMADIN